MKNEDALVPTAPAPEVFQQLGQLTRQLHDTLNHLGVMPKLQQSAHGLPDARSRLSYIVHKTGEAADKVLTSVELAKQEQARITCASQHMARTVAERPANGESHAALKTFLDEVESATRRTDEHLTDMMLAQDFHDLTGQVVSKVITLAMDLEDSLIKLLVQAAPGEQTRKVEVGRNGPVIDPSAQTDMVTNQSEVDDLLARMGF